MLQGHRGGRRWAQSFGCATLLHLEQAPKRSHGHADQRWPLRSWDGPFSWAPPPVTRGIPFLGPPRTGAGTPRNPPAGSLAGGARRGAQRRTSSRRMVPFQDLPILCQLRRRRRAGRVALRHPTPLAAEAKCHEGHR